MYGRCRLSMGPLACMGLETYENQGHDGVSLRTLRVFGNIGRAALRYEGSSRLLSRLSSLVELLLACRTGGDPGGCLE